MNFSSGKFQIALDYFSRAISNHPGSSSTLRVAVACCCYKLSQYERSYAAVQRALTLNVRKACLLDQNIRFIYVCNEFDPLTALRCEWPDVDVYARSNRGIQRQVETKATA